MRGLVFLCCFYLISVFGNAQVISVPLINGDFEQPTLKPWTTLGNASGLTDSTVHSGKQALVLTEGSSVQSTVKLVPLTRYRLTGWLKTESGSGEVGLKIVGLGEHNTGVSSALADWKNIELDFVTDAGQTSATIEITNPENTSKNRAWVDDLRIECVGAFVPVKSNGIKSLTLRVPKTDLGVAQQGNAKLDWLLDAKFGMFIHWGIYSSLASGEWVMENKGISPEKYRTMAYPESGDLYFSADRFNADEWATLAKQAGMKYMNMVTMHHDGYALFDSRYPNAFTAKQTHNRDFVKEYVTACRKQGLRVGLYKTLINWRYPGYFDVNGTDCKSNKFGYTTDSSHRENARLMKEELYCQTKELMTKYGKIDQIYWDGGWLAQQGTDADGAYFWESGQFLDPKNPWPVDPYFQDKDEKTGKPLGLMGMVRKYQPDVLVNPRTGWYGDYKCEEGGQAITGPVRTEEVWEKNMTMASGWGYTPAHNDPSKLISCDGVKRMLADCVIRNMSLLLNVGPDKHGQIAPATQVVLRQTGSWLEKVGEAVYGTRGGPWNPKDGAYGYTYKGNTIYIYLLKDFNQTSFALPTLNKGQKVVGAYSVIDRIPFSFKRLSNGETQLSGFERTDKVVTILAIVLNKPVMVGF